MPLVQSRTPKTALFVAAIAPLRFAVSRCDEQIWIML